MQTILQLLNRSYRKAKIKSKYEDLDQTQIDDGISELNEMMWELEASGLPIGWSDISESTETVPAPDWMLGMITNGLAIRLGNDDGIQLDQRLIGMYESGLNAAYKRLVPVPKIQYPSILPTGGSTDRYRRSTYFNNPNANSLVGQGGFIRDEDGDSLNSDSQDSNAVTNT
jgi:hypothetical protein